MMKLIDKMNNLISYYANIWLKKGIMQNIVLNINIILTNQILVIDRLSYLFFQYF